MITRIVDQNHFQRIARQVRARVPTILSEWGLPPKFNRWRLTQDPDSGMVVLFAMLNTKYIAMHSATPFSNYFDPRLLHDLAADLHMQVVSCSSDGLRYAFILDRGQIDILPTHIDFPFLDGDKLLVRVVYDNNSVPEMLEPQITAAPLVTVADPVDDQTRVHQGVQAFLKVFDDIKLKDDVAVKPPAQGLPGILVMSEEEFNKRVAEHETDRLKSDRIRRLFGKYTQ